MISLDWCYWAILRQHSHAQVVTHLCTMMMCVNEIHKDFDSRVATAFLQARLI